MPTYSAQDIIYRALRTIGVLEAEESATDSMGQDGLDNLNDLLNEWDRRGIGGGYVTLDSLSDEMLLDPDEYRAIRLNLAIDLAVEYSAQISPMLSQMADQSMRLMEAKYTRIQPSCLDDALLIPGGAGYPSIENC